MKNNIPNKPSWFFWAFVVAFLVLGVPIIINESYKASVVYITNWEAADVLSYYAVILSGCITIFTLVCTIEFTRRNTERQLLNQRAQTNVPYFVVFNTENQNENLNTKQFGSKIVYSIISQTPSFFTNESDSIRITLKNIGEGTALSVKCSSGKYVIQESDIPEVVARDNVLDIVIKIKDIKEAQVNDILELTYENTFGILYTQKIEFEFQFIQYNGTANLLVKKIPHQEISI